VWIIYVLGAPAAAAASCSGQPEALLPRGATRSCRGRGASAFWRAAVDAVGPAPGGIVIAQGRRTGGVRIDVRGLVSRPHFSFGAAYPCRVRPPSVAPLWRHPYRSAKGPARHVRGRHGRDADGRTVVLFPAFPTEVLKQPSSPALLLAGTVGGLLATATSGGPHACTTTDALSYSAAAPGAGDRPPP